MRGRASVALDLLFSPITLALGLYVPLVLLFLVTDPAVFESEFGVTKSSSVTGLVYLSLALLETNRQRNLVPGYGSPQHADYEAVNGLLNTVMPSTLAMLATGCLGTAAQDTGKIGRILAFWNMCSARDMAWDFANHLRLLSDGVRPVALAAQDQMTGALGRAILTCV